MKSYQKLTALFRKRSHLQHLVAIGQWDEAVMMPPGGGEARANALGTLHTVLHDLLNDPQVSDLIAQAHNEQLASSWQSANLKQMERIYRKTVCVPAALMERATVAFIRCEQAWRQLRAENNWTEFAPLLALNVELIKEIAGYQAEALGMSPYNALLDEYAPGVTQELLDPIFAKLTAFLPSFIDEVMAQQKQPLPTIGHFPIDKQKQLGMEIMQTIGFNFNHGRLDVSHHPFCGGVPQDVRITTRYDETEFISALMGVCHETGHAMYERGLPPDWVDQPVGEPLGYAVHESQSLLIEMQVCRSVEFLQFLAPLIRKYFGDQQAFNADNLYQQFIHVQPGLIRVDADEVCYPLHVILRYEIEKELIAGNIEVADLPELWDQKMQQFFSLSTRDNYKNGVMQDVHWPCGSFGYFPSYTLGAMLSAQFYQTAVQQVPEIPYHVSQGDFTSLMKWLRQHIHNRGSLLNFNQLIQETTGKPLTVDDFIYHLRQRFTPH